MTVPIRKMTARCFSPVNIALAKYWGKRNLVLNLPTNGSISLTLKDLGSTTSVEWSGELKDDVFSLNGKIVSQEKAKKIFHVLEIVRRLSGIKLRAYVQSENNFPTAAGLASSASGLSSVAFAAVKALGVDISLQKISEISRQGSGSACRSLFGGFVQWNKGTKEDGSDSGAHQIAPSTHWPLGIAVGVVESDEKKVSSSDGMLRSQETSPFFESWVKSAESGLPLFQESILKHDFEKLALLSESNCLRMHACAMASSPPLIYFNKKTVEIYHEVQRARKFGNSVFFTLDAGPNPVLIFEPSAKNGVSEILSGCEKVFFTELGDGTRALS